MRPLDIERLCGMIVPGAGGIDVQPLGVGLLSETYLVARAGARYVLKVAAEHRPNIELEPGWEASVLECAGNAGLAPHLVYSDPRRGVLLAQWAAGRTWTAPDAAGPDGSRRIAGLLRRVHGLAVPAPPRTFSPARWIEMYGAALEPCGPQAGDSALLSAAAARAHEFSRLPATPGVLCHSDLHAMNLIDQDGGLILLDWEYAHVTDPLWDLAGWSANNDLDPQAQSAFLAAYLGGAPRPSQWQRLRLLLWLYDYVCLLWSRLYLSLRGASNAAIAERARLLDARLRLPANYAA
jgi:thiamine kinase-like enzyme